jgi:signal peptidase II
VGSEAAAERTDRAVSPVEGSRLWLMLCLVSAPVLAADQLSKAYVSGHLQIFQLVRVVPGWLDFTYTLNPGAAFSLFATMPTIFRESFFIILSAIAIVVLVVLLTRRSTPLSSGIAFGLILGGTVGNLIDRVARGRVVDFIYFHHNSFSYPVFNIADSAITIGVGMLLLYAAIDQRQPGEGR